MFKLTDLIELSGVKLDDFKVHCATGIETTQLEAFLDGTWKDWQETQNQRNFECKQIVSLIHLGANRWLFAGVFEVLGGVSPPRLSSLRFAIYGRTFRPEDQRLVHQFSRREGSRKYLYARRKHFIIATHSIEDMWTSLFSSRMRTPAWISKLVSQSEIGTDSEQPSCISKHCESAR